MSLTQKIQSQGPLAQNEPARRPPVQLPHITEAEVTELLGMLGLSGHYRQQVANFYREQRIFFKKAKLMNPRLSIELSKQRMREIMEQEGASEFAKPWHKQLLLNLMDHSNMVKAAFRDAKAIIANR